MATDLRLRYAFDIGRRNNNKNPPASLIHAREERP